MFYRAMNSLTHSCSWPRLPTVITIRQIILLYDISAYVFDKNNIEKLNLVVNFVRVDFVWSIDLFFIPSRPYTNIY
jgi:hypothetical protein